MHGITLVASRVSIHITTLAVLLAAASQCFAQDSKDLIAAKRGDSSAQVRVAYYYRDQRSDNKTALLWFSKAAGLGNMEAVDNLGWMREHGMAVPRDEAKAQALYRKSAEGGNPGGQVNLARCLCEGIGGEKDVKEALKWAAASFHSDKDRRAPGTLINVLLDQADLRPHEKLIADLGAVNDSAILTKVARIYYEGIGRLPKNPAKVAMYFMRARQHGFGEDMCDAMQIERLAARRKVPGVFVYMPTQHLDQGYNMCAPTAAAMALQFYLCQPVDPYAIKANSTGATEPGTGTAWDCMLHGIKAVSGRTWVFRSWPNNDAGFEKGLPVLLGELDAGHVALIDLGPHTVVLVGYDSKRRVVYIQNPAYSWPGIHTVSYDKLKEKWHSPWHVTTTKGVEARPVLLTGDSAG